MTGKKDLERLRRRKQRKHRIIRFTVRLFVWGGFAVLYYLGFSLFFDTPFEYDLKHKTDELRTQYEALTARYDSLMMVVDNLSERDKNVFQTLFESTPNDFSSKVAQRRNSTYEEVAGRSSQSLRKELDRRSEELTQRMAKLQDSYRTLEEHIEAEGSNCTHIPSIQPVINKKLSLLTASYGMRYHPFYKTLQPHQGVDYTLPEGSRVFATADGTVSQVMMRNSTSGMTVVIDHGNGYTTSFHHLSKVHVRRGEHVRRGDIIALSGNTGLSLAPHLHYEVRYNGMRVDPIHYFFMELSPSDYQRLMLIAQTGMQSFD